MELFEKEVVKDHGKIYYRYIKLLIDFLSVGEVKYEHLRPNEAIAKYSIPGYAESGTLMFRLRISAGICSFVITVRLKNKTVSFIFSRCRMCSMQRCLQHEGSLLNK